MRWDVRSDYTHKTIKTSFPMKVQKLPVTVDAFSFEEFVEYGKQQYASTNTPLPNGMPWRFQFHGHLVTHENDDCYIVPTKEGEMRFNRDTDLLMLGVDGEIYPIKKEIFEKTYRVVGPPPVPHGDYKDITVPGNVPIEIAGPAGLDNKRRVALRVYGWNPDLNERAESVKRFADYIIDFLNCPPTDFARAVETFRRGLVNDPELLWVYHCSLMCSFFDAGAPHDIASEGSARFLQSLTGADVRKDSRYAPRKDETYESLFRYSLSELVGMVPAPEGEWVTFEQYQRIRTSRESWERGYNTIRDERAASFAALGKAVGGVGLTEYQPEFDIELLGKIEGLRITAERLAGMYHRLCLLKRDDTAPEKLWFGLQRILALAEVPKPNPNYVSSSEPVHKVNLATGEVTAESAPAPLVPAAFLIHDPETNHTIAVINTDGLELIIESYRKSGREIVPLFEKPTYIP